MSLFFCTNKAMQSASVPFNLSEAHTHRLLRAQMTLAGHACATYLWLASLYFFRISTLLLLLLWLLLRVDDEGEKIKSHTIL